MVNVSNYKTFYFIASCAKKKEVEEETGSSCGRDSGAASEKAPGGSAYDSALHFLLLLLSRLFKGKGTDSATEKIPPFLHTAAFTR